MSRDSAAGAVGLTQARADAAYDRWAPIYDVVFNLPFQPGRGAAARAAGEATPPNGELLVVGVGTGLELALLPRHARVTGVDLSIPMLEAARARVARLGLDHVRALVAMDAGAMNFEADRFESVLAPYVMSVVPNPTEVLDEAWRVLKPGGELEIVNHFFAGTGIRAGAENWLEHRASWLGWHPAFPFSTVGDWVAEREDADWRERRNVAPFDLFTLLRIGKRADRRASRGRADP